MSDFKVILPTLQEAVTACVLMDMKPTTVLTNQHTFYDAWYRMNRVVPTIYRGYAHSWLQLSGIHYYIGDIGNETYYDIFIFEGLSQYQVELRNGNLNLYVQNHNVWNEFKRCYEDNVPNTPLSEAIRENFWKTIHETRRNALSESNTEAD